MGTQIREVMGWAKQRKLLATLLVSFTLLLGILIGTVVSDHVGASRPFSSSGATPLAIPDPVKMSSAFSGIVAKVEPAVVNISTTQVIERQQRQRRPRGTQPDPFQDFFDRFFDYPDQGQPQTDRSLGSGMVVDRQGFILTNKHVIEDATKIQVQLPHDTNKYTAKVIGSDDETDLAVIKIDAGKDLPSVKLGNSDGVEVGDWVLAIGSPFGLRATVTAGIVSAKDRSNSVVLGARQFQRFLQTDAAINPGNSGGPLVDMAGQVIGVNTAIMTGSRGYEGVGFALPSTTAINVYNQLISSGKVTRGSIGVSFNEEQGTNPVMLRQLGAQYGVQIQTVEPNGPADKAGIRSGDIITSVNGKAVHDGNDLVNPIAATPVGEKVKIGYVRDGKPHDATVTVDDRAKIFPATAATEDNRPDESGPVEFGLRVDDLTAQRARQLGFDVSSGVIVTQVQPASFAEDLGFARGDVIAEINHEPVASAADYRKLVAKLKVGQDVLFKVLRMDPRSQRTSIVYLAGAVPSDSKQ